MKNKEEKKIQECEFCEGKGYTQLQACYDEIHSREECNVCMGDGIKVRKEKEKWQNIKLN